MEDGTLIPEPEQVLARRLKRKGNRAGIELLIQWKGMSTEDTMWVDLDELKKKFPDLEDKVF